MEGVKVKVGLGLEETEAELLKDSVG